MYHSEAVLLSDGRVMISGSDPQDPDHPQEYRIEVYVPPYLVDGRIQPQILALPTTDWVHGQVYTITLQLSQTGPIRFSLLGAVASTHGSSMGIRTIFPEVTSIQPSYPHGVDSLCSSIALAIRALLKLHQTNTSAREFLITDVAIDKLTMPTPFRPGWFQLFALDGPTPSHAKWVRIGGDPAKLGEWPPFADFTKPGL